MAMINVGYMYQNGLAGLEQDAHKAFVLYQEGVKVCFGYRC
jgi:TPR repeat protein